MSSLASNEVRYLLLGGFAVAHYGYPRNTDDIDIWIEISPDNADRVTSALRDFGFVLPASAQKLLTLPEQVLRMGVPPLRIELLTSPSGVEFADCYARREVAVIEGVEISVISLPDLKRNKAASGRGKDLVDLEHLP